MVETDYDVLIIGGGAAGFTAAIYAQRYGLKTAVIAKEFGGATALAGEIENYPGFIGSGRDLMTKFIAQSDKFGAEKITGTVDSIAKEGDLFTVDLGEKKLTSKAVIAGVGSKHRKLGVPGETELLGKGVSVCATCDGNFFRGKTVLVVGGGDAAAKSILYLSEICEKVYVSYRKELLRCEPIYLERINAKKNVELIYNSVVEEIEGESVVTGVRLKPFSDKMISKDFVEVQGVFIEIGADPIVDIFKDLGVELEKGAVKIDCWNKTSIKGLFAAGDGTTEPFKQTITAAAGGATAAKGAYDYIQEKNL